MIIGIWRAKRNPAKSLEEIKKFQHDYVVKEMQSVKGCLGVLNFHSETEWGTIQIWESVEADDAEDNSPQAKKIYEAQKAAGLLPLEGETSYERFEVHNGFAVKDVFEKYLK